MSGLDVALISGILAAMASFIGVWAREQRRAQAAADLRLQRVLDAADARLQRVLDTSERRADRDREAHEHTWERVVSSLQAHVAGEERTLEAIRGRLSDVHDAVMSSPCRAKGGAIR